MTEAQSLKLEADECATLSPESGRFRSVYQQVQPRSAKEVRELLGLSPEATSAVHAAGNAAMAEKCQQHLRRRKNSIQRTL